MKKFVGVMLFILAALLMTWSIISGLSLILNYDTPANMYQTGQLIGRTFAVGLLGFLGFRAFKAGKRRFVHE